jgi:hypothetical protein
MVAGVGPAAFETAARSRIDVAQPRKRASGAERRETAA